jgi:hypothetical protein
VKRNFLILLVVALAALAVFPVAAHDVPTVEVQDQNVLDGWVTIDHVTSEGPGFVVIHIDNGGRPGGVLGFRWVNPGENNNVRIKLDPAMATPTTTLYAMLHVDDGEVGTYEFDGSSGLDNPVSVDGNVVTPAFTVNTIWANDQVVDGTSVSIGSVWAAQDSWIVIHKDDGGRPGGVIGQTLVPTGVANDVVVELTEDATEILWPMLHVDDGAAGTYEFDGSSGLDNPVRASNGVAVTSIWTVPHVRAFDQIVLHGDGMEMEGAPTVTAVSVLSDGPGVLVYHKDDGGKPGGVAGFAFVNDGFNANVVAELDPAETTPVLWPMLHVDDGAVGTYEFDGSSGLDNPVSDSAGNVIVFPISIAPSIDYAGSLEDNVMTLHDVLIDAPGFVAIHADNGSGQPGPVVGTAPLVSGVNGTVTIELGEGATEQLFPMLHYDSNNNGVYEFDGQNGLDGPVFVGGNVVVGPFAAGI